MEILIYIVLGLLASLWITSIFMRSRRKPEIIEPIPIDPTMMAQQRTEIDFHMIDTEDGRKVLRITTTSYIPEEYLQGLYVHLAKSFANRKESMH